jgi:hypothetical protein
MSRAAGHPENSNGKDAINARSRTMHPHLKTALGTALALTLALPAGAMAAGTSASGDVTGSTLDLTAPGTASWAAGVTLDGTDKAATFAVPTTVNDQRGTGAGWNLTVTSTQFANSGGKALPMSASVMTGVTSACAGDTCTNPTNAVSYGLPVPADSGTLPDPVKFFNAAADSGMGKFTVTPSVAVTVPANSYAGTYTSTLTLAATTGP